MKKKEKIWTIQRYIFHFKLNRCKKKTFLKIMSSSVKKLIIIIPTRQIIHLHKSWHEEIALCMFIFSLQRQWSKCNYKYNYDHLDHLGQSKLWWELNYFLLLDQNSSFISEKAGNYSRGREVLRKSFPPFQECTPIYPHTMILLDSVTMTINLFTIL